MNKLFLLTSSIELREDKPFECYRAERGRRSIFSANERLQHTKSTVASIRKDHPTDKIVIVDSSNTSYKNQLDGVDYIHLKDICDDQTYNIVTTHPHKCICESTLLNTYCSVYEKFIHEFNFVIKVTGRYQIGNINNAIFSKENLNKIFFKHPYPMNPNDLILDALFTAQTKRDGIFPHEYDQALYGFGIQKFNFMKNIYQQTIEILQPSKMRFIDIEKVMYLLTRSHVEDIVLVDWNVAGFDGMTGLPVSR